MSECVCVCVSGELCLCVYLSKLFACSGVCDEANYVRLDTTQTYTLVFEFLSRVASRGGCCAFPALISV